MPSSRTRGIFITFEGVEGAGKSTLIRELATQLGSRFKRQITLTREPGGNPVAEKIRSVILNEAMDPKTELFLYEAARAEHLAKTILPALKAGHVVLCDRFADSSLAYQAHARGLDWKLVKKLNELATGGLKPHMTIMLDVDPAIGLARASDQNRFEAEGLAFQKKVRAGFLKAAREEPKRWRVIRVKAQTPGELSQQVAREIEKSFGKLL
jgi:dTMP kinase